MSPGVIVRVALPPANVEEQQSACHVFPLQGMVFGDEAYGVGQAARAMRGRGLHSGAVLKEGMKAKDRDEDRWPNSDAFRGNVLAVREAVSAPRRRDVSVPGVHAGSEPQREAVARRSAVGFQASLRLIGPSGPRKSFEGLAGL